ncbi:MAG: hypothetical protein AAF721_09065 [Myxococcota bacterium]
MTTDADETLRTARARYFAANDFGDNGGYDDAWVKLKLGPIPMAFPNSAQRVRAVRFHDLHHVLTGYQTDFTGEAEIGAWEVATGCRDMWAAWVLNLLAMLGGSIVAHRRVYAAFVRGRREANLYGETFDDALLDRRVEEVRRALEISETATPPRSGDLLAFAGWLAVAEAMVLAAIGLALTPLLALWWLVG